MSQCYGQKQQFRQDRVLSNKSCKPSREAELKDKSDRLTSANLSSSSLSAVFVQCFFFQTKLSSDVFCRGVLLRNFQAPPSDSCGFVERRENHNRTWLLLVANKRFSWGAASPLPVSVTRICHILRERKTWREHAESTVEFLVYTSLPAF